MFKGLDVQLEDPLCVAARVDGFMKFMKQKFTEDEKKQKFSFKTYCDSILGNFPPVEQGEPQPSLQFKQLLKTSEDQGVARNLLATLMLVSNSGCAFERLF
jgi:Condensin II complex subunit CAP-H2 or CNDH2, C-term